MKVFPEGRPCRAHPVMTVTPLPVLMCGRAIALVRVCRSIVSVPPVGRLCQERLVTMVTPRRAMIVGERIVHVPVK